MFEITRADGRSNTQVIIDLVRDKTPGTLFKFGDLAAALKVGTSRDYSTPLTRQAVLNANNRLLREHKRVLHSVRRIGYRLAEATKHHPLALARKSRADVQMRRGVELLRYVRWEELDANARAAHEGTLLVMEALYQQNQAMERRQNAIEEAISRLREDVDGLKQK